MTSFIRGIRAGVLVAATAVCAQQTDTWSMEEQESAASPVSGDAYVVKKWDTMWDLAQQYLSDPFRWAEIWQLNKHIANPDLIYPGDRLVLPGMGPSGAARLETPPAASGLAAQQTEALTRPDFSEVARGLGAYRRNPDTSAAPQTPAASDWGNDETARFVETRLLQSLITKNYFSPDFLARVGFLWFEKDAKGRIAPGNGSIAACKEDAVYRQFDRFGIDLFGQGRYAPNDTIDVFHADGLVRFEGTTANLVRRIARARIVSVNGPSIQAELFKVWDVVRCGDRVAPVQRTADRRIDALAAADNPVDAAVFQRVETTESPYLYQTFLIDRGSARGIELGDVFAVYPVVNKQPAEDPSMVACAVHVGDKSSTLVIVKMFGNRLAPGDAVRLIKRIRFKQG